MDRMDEAVTAALAAQYGDEGADVTYTPTLRRNMRAAILASLPVLLGEQVGEIVHGEGGPGGVMLRRRPGFGWHELPSGTKLYAPSLGEGDGR